MRTTGPLLFVLVWLAPLLLAVEAQAEEPNRLTWAGISRGPFAPAKARALERLLLDELDGYDSFRLVDVSGHALDARLLGSEAARCAALKNEGVDLLLKFEYAAAIKKLDQAIAVFEARLPSLPDHELLHDALLAKAEAQFHAGEKSAAKTTLRQLLALTSSPRPTLKTHEKAFVTLYDKAKADLDAVGRIHVSCEEPGCRVQLDGQVLGDAPLLATRILPGRHYVVASWPDVLLFKIVQVRPGDESKVTLVREGPPEESREELMTVLERKAGPEAAHAPAAKVAALALAQGVLLAAIRADAEGKNYLLLASHERLGGLAAIARVAIPEQLESAEAAAAVRRLSAVLFVDKRTGELDLNAEGAAKSAPGVASMVYGGFGEAPKEVLPGEAEEPPPPALLPSQMAAAQPPPEESSFADHWWLWALIGVAVVGVGVGAGALLIKSEPQTTSFEVRLP